MTLTIPPGETDSEGRVTIAAVNNEVSGTSKEVTVSGSAENDHDIDQPATQTLTITEDDVASTVVMLTLSPEEVREGAAGRVTVMAMLDGVARPNPTELEIRVLGDTADEGVDFAQVQPFTLEIPAGQRSGSASFTLTAFDNAVSGPDKTVLVEATTTSGLSIEEPADGLVVTITDDEDAPVASLVLTPASIREDGGESVVTADGLGTLTGGKDRRARGQLPADGVPCRPGASGAGGGGAARSDPRAGEGRYGSPATGGQALTRRRAGPCGSRRRVR